MAKSKSIKITFRKGQLAGDTSWWTEKDWEEHNAYVKELEESGEFGNPFDMTFNFQTNEEFNKPKEPIFSDFQLLIPQGKYGKK